MRVLIIGGTGFIGPHLARQLLAAGHSVAVFHRGNSRNDLAAEHILGDRRDLVKLRPGDYARRFHPVLKRIDDGPRAIIFERGCAAWRPPRGYVENVAAAIALAATDERAAGRIYNVAEMPAFSELEWARKIAAAASWNGEFVVLPKERAPKHLAPPGNTEQHWEADSSRIRRELGYREVVGLEEGIRRTIEWERANPTGGFNPHVFDYAAEDSALDSNK